MQKKICTGRGLKNLVVNLSSYCMYATIAIYDSITAGRDFHPAPKMNQYYFILQLYYNELLTKSKYFCLKNPIKFVSINATRC